MKKIKTGEQNYVNLSSFKIIFFSPLKFGAHNTRKKFNVFGQIQFKKILISMFTSMKIDAIKNLE